MGRALPLALVLAGAGCYLDNPSYDDSGDAGGSGSSGPGSATATTTATSTTATTATTSGGATTSSGTGDASTGSGATTTSGDPTTGTSGTTGGEGVYPVKSCLELLDYLKGAGLPTLSGIYEINHPTLPQETVRVFCDLVTDGGGWLLVGRSHSSGALGNFGWRSATGSVDDDGAPYSLGLHLHPFAVNEILIGDYAAGKSWGDALYLVVPPAGFVDFKMEAHPVLLIETLLGACQSPTMLTNIGFTELNGAFFLRDTTVYDGADYGLLHDMLWTFYDGGYSLDEQCNKGGFLATKQGMVMIR
ncbi:MAG: hypothetical protein H6710_16670 [Myxococcales bacterium]|nr:hypothetical protein [Myxococcales bacterium]MCB9704827.1 hypothetical protein [Myxococcales bacterium]